MKSRNKREQGEFNFFREFIEEDDQFLATDFILMQSNEGGNGCAKNFEKDC